MTPGKSASRRRQLTRVEGGDDVGVLNFGQRSHLGAEALADVGGAVVIDRHGLDGGAAFHEAMLGQEHVAHAAGAELVEHAVIADEEAVGGAVQNVVEPGA